jgi:hypothetical protein
MFSFSCSARLSHFHHQGVVGFTVVNKMNVWLLREQAGTGIARFHKPHKHIDTNEVNRKMTNSLHTTDIRSNATT